MSDRIGPYFVPIKLDEDNRAIKIDGKEIYICPVCDRETTDVVRVYHGHCHKNKGILNWFKKITKH